MGCKPDIKTTKEMFDLYSTGFSLSQVGSAFGVTRQAVFKRFKKSGLNLRKNQRLPFIIWNKEKYTLRENGYYANTKNKRKYLHRELWEIKNGPIPGGHEIHHLDGNKENNDLSNMVLCTTSEHGRKHGFAGNQYVFVSNKRPSR